MSKTIVLEQFLFSSNRSIAERKKTKRQRIYIMPTRHGILFGLMLFAMLLGAVNYNNSMAYILTFLLSSLFLVGLLHTYKNLAGLIIDEALPLPVFSGDLANFPLIIDNRSGFLRFAISFLKVPEKKWHLKSIFQRSKTINSLVTTHNIDAKKLNHIEIPIKTSQRGHLKAGRIKIVTHFPLGLFKAWSTINMQQSCLVYPKPAGKKSFPPYKRARDTGIQGNNSGTDDFAGFRNYQIGDRIRDIAWKAYAQEKGLFVKRFSGTGSDKLYLNWDDVSHLTKIESRLSQLCRWIIEAESQSLHYALELPETSVDTGHGEKHRHLCLSSLAKYGLKNEL